MRWVFWCSAALVLYSYLGYPLWLWVRSRWRGRQVGRSGLTHSVSIVMVVRDEEAALAGKLRNLSSLDYPADRLEILVVSDGSTDGTDAILQEWAARGAIHLIVLTEHCGKALGLKQARPVAHGEAGVFTEG